MDEVSVRRSLTTLAGVFHSIASLAAGQGGQLDIAGSSVASGALLRALV